KNELTVNFNTSKKARLDDITLRGTQLKSENEQLVINIDAYTKRIEDGGAFIQKLKGEIESITSAIELEQSVLNSQDTKSYDDTLKLELTAKQTDLDAIKPIDNFELQQQKTEINNKIKQLNDQLALKVQIDSANKRIEELQKEESSLSKSLLDLEKQEFDIEKYIKLGIEALESSINGKFKTVKFKLFDTQINGGEVECCDALIDGVTFHSANTASRINAGIDIINTLSEFYQTTAPIIIDNRESVSKLIDTHSQLINLIVSEKDIALRTA